ncbi:hypothetical protein NNC19_23070, partial [Clostridium sp. SHJSY1]|uniref:hypothetical protein n=1 Tax=Clostridium sp. SHJSY1 TaxID=2942483 RepID=UPI0028761AE7
GETTDLVPKEELLEEGIETKKNVLKDKKNIQILIIIIIVVGLFSIYKFLYSKYNTRIILEQYCNYLVNKDYENAYKMLYNTDNDFMSEEMFEKSLKDVDFSGYSIKEYSKRDNKDEKIEINDTTYEIQVNGFTYIAEVSPKGSKNPILKDYKINAKNLAIKDWNFTVPKGTEIFVNDKKVNGIIETSIDTSHVPVEFSIKYEPESETYKIGGMFKGKCNITFKLDSTEDIVKNDVQAGYQISKVSLNFKQKKELTEELTNQTKKFLEAYYNKTDMTDLIISNSDIIEKVRAQENLYNSTGKSINMKDDIVLQNTAIDDNAHASICFMFTENYTSTYYNGSRTVSKVKTIYFKKENHKWLVCTTNLF